MYSDIPADASYPYTGNFQIQGDRLMLGEPVVMSTGESAENYPEMGLYSDRWEINRKGLSIRLHAATDKKDDQARTLIPDCQFDPREPFRNQQYLKP